jgi:NAD(P)-dependent dehydrogenase (short-subunit alcohol dehydrogenase family)
LAEDKSISIEGGPLKGAVMSTVAVVTGAARGVGRGVALVLGEMGATVYVTDRESRGRKTSELPGTVEDTAEQVDARGGRGIPVPLDHTDDQAVAALFERVRDEQGGLDLLVANAFNGNALPFAGGPFWTLPLEHWRNMFDMGVRGHLVSAWHAAPLLISRRGLLVLTGYADPGADVIANHLFYDLAMTGISRLAHSLAHDLRPHGVTALAVSPGFTRTEAIVAALGPAPAGSDSVEFPGRAVRALFEDSQVARHAGRTIPVAELAKEYGFTDVEAGDAVAT